VKLKPFDPHTAGEHELAAVHRCNQQIRAERVPDDPPRGYEQFVADLRNVPPIVKLIHWTAWDDAEERVLGWAATALLLHEGSEHLAHVDLTVLPQQRRQGIGTSLLSRVVETAREHDRRVLIGETMSTVPAGESFAQAFGATPAITSQIGELHLADVDRALVRTWIERAQERATGFELGWWLDGYPEDRVDEVAVMLEAFNTQPLGELDIEFHFTPDQVRALDASNAARGITRWTCYVREAATGALAGFTEISYAQSLP
jgi:GNAT superfamily N-acetyltransferase